MEPGQKRRQGENTNKEAIVVKGEKKHRTVEYEQDVMSTMGSTEVAGQEDTPKKKKKKKTHHFDVHVNQEGVVWHFFWFSGHPSENSLFLQ